MATDPNGKKEYKAQSIRVLEGLEAVRKRPGMYIGSTGPSGLHHLVYEVVDNSVDEALAGHCDTITITLHEDESCSVEDNGRGIPTGIHPTEGISAATVVLTKLHAGGKFDKDSYKFSGGLHGVGISVVNALSKKLYLSIFQDGKIHQQTFQRGIPQDKLHITGNTNKCGTLITFFPDDEIFTETLEFNFETLAARFRELAFLNKKLRITISDERSGKISDFYYEGGIVSFVEHMNAKKTPLFKEVIHCEKEDEANILEIALQYNEGYGETLYSFVNNINTVEGGTHVSGFRAALTKTCNKKAQDLKVLKPGESFSSDDVREGLIGVISIKIPEPQFEGQTKTKLGNSDIKGVVESWLNSFLDTFFEENPAIARKILLKAEGAKRAREAAKRARELTRRKTVFESAVLPGKLADCTSESASKTELFIVEGDSAGGSAKQARDRMIQAILPLKGKILNVEKARVDKILANEEIKAIISAIGSGIGQEFNIEKARYHKIIIMTDADIDGAHIRTLLLTFFFRYMRPIIESGYLYIAQPPLYKVKIGRLEKYLKDDSSLKDFLFNWASDHTHLSFDQNTLSTDQWIQLLSHLTQYDDQVEKVSRALEVTYDQAHSFALACIQSQWFESNDVQALLIALQKTLAPWKIAYQEAQQVDPEESNNTPHHAGFMLTLLNQGWLAPIELFKAAELKKLVNLYEPLARLVENKWTLQIIGKEAKLTNIGITALIRAIAKISKPYMNIQRYKGLGEMNPEQLWETAMDPDVRLMTRVNIKDAVEADNWFSTLMGDDVAGRKQFIEQYGHFVRNLDV